MNPRRLVIFGLGLAALIIAAALVLNLSPGNSPATQADGLSSANASRMPASVSPSKAPTPESAASGSAKASAESNANPNAPAAKPDPARPLEVAAPAPAKTDVALPASRHDGPLVKAPLPKAGSATGELVAGFPTNIMPTVSGSKVASSSVSPQQQSLQVSLVASVQGTEPGAVMQFYINSFGALGLGAAKAPANSGSSAMWFTRGSDKITLTTTPSEGGGTDYIIFGVLHADS